jgi:hypothetical protein
MILVYPAGKPWVQLTGKRRVPKWSGLARPCESPVHVVIQPTFSMFAWRLVASGEFREGITQYIDAEVAACRFE